MPKPADDAARLPAVDQNITPPRGLLPTVQTLADPTFVPPPHLAHLPKIRSYILTEHLIDRTEVCRLCQVEYAAMAVCNGRLPARTEQAEPTTALTQCEMVCGRRKPVLRSFIMTEHLFTPDGLCRGCGVTEKSVAFCHGR